MPSQRILSSSWHDVFSARVKLFCPESVLKGCVLPPFNTVQTSRRLQNLQVSCLPVQAVMWLSVSAFCAPPSPHRLTRSHQLMRTMCISRESSPGHTDGNDVFYH